jgi:catechol 2,3-dioxygenase-like lactoylglutathione lyase family enzyme
MSVARIDHVAFAARDLSVTVAFYGDVLGLMPLGDPYRIDGRPVVQRVGAADILLSIHQRGNGASPVAGNPVTGALDICFEWNGDIDTALAHLASRGIELSDGPVARRSSDGAARRSLYFRDPDDNLIELMAREPER